MERLTFNLQGLGRRSSSLKDLPLLEWMRHKIFLSNIKELPRGEQGKHMSTVNPLYQDEHGAVHTAKSANLNVSSVLGKGLDMTTARGKTKRMKVNGGKAKCKLYIHQNSLEAPSFLGTTRSEEFLGI